ncbi:DUF3800 domain-containing protein [Lacticaseibacillus paracasei]|uniref:DUF3800 domain-containing protein n=1 Tax=Lacticaseibacillus paracasei TaxID=1597 RepID=UPI0031D41573
MDETQLSIYIDESGTLCKSDASPDYFVYGGFWCTSDQSENISANFGRELIRLFPSCKNGEKKASTMKHRKERILLSEIVSDSEGSFHPVFVSEYLKSLEKPLSTKEEKQLHKNYLLRRFVEKCIVDFRQCGYTSETINVYIDDQPKTKIISYDDFPNYLSNHLHAQYYSPSYITSNAKISVKFMDSNFDRRIQLCDVLANAKWNHYIHGHNDVEKGLEKADVTRLKLP